jgi:putative PIG3 family NAD(P)H quinone oxidoreductase
MAEAMMKAIGIPVPGPYDALVLENRPRPVPAGRQVLVRVHAAGVNRPDVFQRLGNYPPPPGAPDIPGLEIAGEVAALGSEATTYRVGDAITALVPGGGYAEYAVVDERNALPLPRGFSMVEAAAIPETFFTVWPNVFDRGRLQAGETILVHGGASGIGTTAIQLAKAFGARVIVTVGDATKCDACRRLGADLAINYREADFVAAVKEATGGAGANLILDMVGGDYVNRNYDAAAPEGRIVQIATLQGLPAKADIARLMQKRLTHTGSTLRPRPVEFKAEVARALHEKVWPLLEARRVAPVIDSTFPLADAPKAHARIDDPAHVGKIVLTVAG